MKIKALAPWFGGKRSMADRIVAELGEHKVYWEPFCGSMAVLFAKPPCGMETVNDLHGDLINLARVVQDAGASVELYRRLSATLLDERQFSESARQMQGGTFCDDGGFSADAAYHYFVVSWMGRNGTSGTPITNGGFCARFTNNGGHAATRFRSAVESIPSWYERLRSATVLNRDGFDLLERIDDKPGTVIYLDPPYVEKGAKYVHDFKEDDHCELFFAADRFKRARVVVSYYDHPKVRKMYAGWTFVDCTRTKSLVSQGARDGKNDVKAPEVLIVNGESYTCTAT